MARRTQLHTGLSGRPYGDFTGKGDVEIVFTPLGVEATIIPPVVSAGVFVTLSPLDVEASIVAPSITANVSIAPTPLGIEATIVAPSLVVGQAIAAAPLVVEAVIVAPSITVGWTVELSPLLVESTLVAVAVSSPVQVQPSPLSIEATVVGPAVVVGTTLALSPLSVEATIVAPHVSTGTGVTLSPLPVEALIIAPTIIAHQSHRLRADTLLYNNRPFEGEGHSLYVTAGSSVLYRRRRIMGGRWIRGADSTFDYGAESVAKTTRVASAASPATSIPYTLPAALASQELAVDVRHYKDDVECEVEGFRTRGVELDGDLEPVTEIRGSATKIAAELRTGGTVRLKFLYSPSRDGVQPYLFRALRTAGPTSPAAVTTRYFTDRRTFEIDVPSLSDSAAYTYTIRAENQAGTVTADLITGWSFTPDATGPSVPGEVSAVAW